MLLFCTLYVLLFWGVRLQASLLCNPHLLIKIDNTLNTVNETRYMSMVRSVLASASHVWSNISKLEMVQRAARFVLDDF